MLCKYEMSLKELRGSIYQFQSGNRYLIGGYLFLLVGPPHFKKSSTWYGTPAPSHLHDRLQASHLCSIIELGRVES